DDAEDGLTGLAPGRLAEDLEHLLEPLDMALALLEMLLESGFQLTRLRCLCHLRQRFHDLLFGVVDVLEGIEEQVVQGLVGHCNAPCWGLLCNGQAAARFPSAATARTPSAAPARRPVPAPLRRTGAGGAGPATPPSAAAAGAAANSDSPGPASPRARGWPRAAPADAARSPVG